MKINLLHNIRSSLFLMCLGVSSCIMDNRPVAKENVPVVLQFFANSSANMNTPDNTPEGNISTIRIYVFRSGTPVQTGYFYGIATPNDLGGYTINEMEVMPGNNDFYIFINESKFGNLNLSEKTPLYVLENLEFNHLPNQNGVVTDGLPIAHVEKNIQVKDQELCQLITPAFNVKRAIGKINFYFAGQSAASPVTINSISINHAPDKSSVFPSEAPIDIQYNQNIPFFSGSATINKYITEQPILPDMEDQISYHEFIANFSLLPAYPVYLLESRKGHITIDITYTRQDDEPVTVNVPIPKDLMRNQQINIFGWIPDKRDIQITYQVNDWQTETIEIPPFN